MTLRREHMVPWPARSVAILRNLYSITRYRKTTRSTVLRNMGYERDTQVAHGFRSTARTLLHEPPVGLQIVLA